MPSNTECIQARSDVMFQQTFSNNYFAFSTLHHGVRVLNAENCESVLSLNSEYINFKTSAIALSQNLTHLACSIDSYIYVIDLKTKKTVKKLYAHKEKITLLTFDPSSTYILAGTKSNRVLQFRYDETTLLSRIFSFEEPKEKSFGITTLEFDTDKLLVSGNRGQVALLNIYSQRSKLIYVKNDREVSSAIFLDNNYIACAYRNGDILILSTKSSTFIKKISTPFTHVKQMIQMYNKRYMLVSGDAASLALIDLQEYKISVAKYLLLPDEIQHISLLDETTLLISLLNKVIFKVHLPSETKIDSYITQSYFDKAYDMIEGDPMLQGSQKHKELEEKYNEIVANIIEALVKQNRDLAKKHLKAIENIDSKKEDIQLIFKSFDNYSKFQKLYLEKKYALAYNLVNKFPALEQTFQYKKMEELFKDAFMNAYRHVLIGRKENAIALLQEYVSAISKRPIIKLILNQSQEFLTFIKAVESKNMQKINELIRINSSFKLLQSYLDIEMDFNDELSLIEKYIYQSDIQNLKKTLTKVKNLPKVKIHMSNYLAICNNLEALQKAYKENNFFKCYELVDTHESLQDIELAYLLQKHWKKLMHTCDAFALKGDIKGVKTTLKELITLPTRSKKIGSLLRVSFHAKIKMLIAAKAYKKAEHLIYSYLDIFGIDTDISLLMKQFEKISKIKPAIPQAQRIDRDAWLNSSLIVS